MNPDSATTSLWMDTAHAPALPPLDGDLDAQVCIVGAGIAGLSTAYQLARAGTRVLVLDERGLAGGQTARTTGHLCNALDDRYFDLERLHGVDGARAAARSHAAAIDLIERICHEERIGCDFLRVDGYLVQGRGDTRAGVLDREYEAAIRAGVDCERVPGAPGALAVFGDALRFRHQARMDALRYQIGLLQAVERLGGRVRRASVAQVHGGREAGVETSDGRRLHSDAVVVATNVPFNDRLAIHTKQAAYRTYVIALRVAPDAVPDALLWDTLDPYHYVRLVQGYTTSWLMVGGEDRKVGQDDDPAAREVALEAWAREYFPMAGDIDYRWSGQVIEPMDGLAYIGRNPGLDDNVYVVTGDSGNGLTHGTIAGLLLAGLIAGGQTDEARAWSGLYAANRKNLHASEAFLRENLNFVPYYGEWVSGGDIDSPHQLAPGEGAVLRDGAHKVAAFRDPEGELHLHSATCPHLGCVVHFNPTESSWDCPCHGSRFDARDGARLNGPADRGLAPADFAHPAALRTHVPARPPSAHH
jgi:glycine/D-amino acid oxidase-like deaminating enzyme/nitrite reductase/ring-hydroxylating ferredoxin subunit